jgi:putative transposase
MSMGQVIRIDDARIRDHLGEMARGTDRMLLTSAGEVNLKIPKLRRRTFETIIVERCRRSTQD